MKITLEELLRKRSSLATIIEKELPTKASFKLSKALRIINTEIQEFDTVRNDLIKKLGTKDKEGGISIKENTPQAEEFNKEILPVLQEELNLEIDAITIDELGDIEISAKDLEPLIDFVIKEK